jgi:hypothetical protein
LSLAKVISELTSMVLKVFVRLKNRKQTRKLYVNYFTGGRIRVGMVSGWVRSIMKDAGKDTEVYSPYSVKHAAG